MRIERSLPGGASYQAQFTVAPSAEGLEAVHEIARAALATMKCALCEGALSYSQQMRKARYCSSACRAKGHDRRDPRISNASIEQLEGELLSRLDPGKVAHSSGVEGPTVRALTRNVRVLKATWMKLRSMTPKATTYMLHLERLINDAWIKEDAP